MFDRSLTSKIKNIHPNNENASGKFVSPVGSDTGFSLPELLVSLLISGSVIGVAFTIAFFNRNIFLRDTSRTDVNQNLRAGIDLVGTDIRQAGERLPEDFPAVILNPNGDDGGPDRLIVYSALDDVVLNVCLDVIAGGNADVGISDPDQDPLNILDPRCLATNVVGDAIAAWRDIRVENGGVIDAYIYDPVTFEGEFFQFDAEDTVNHTISRSGGGWDNSYPAANQPRLYLLQQREFFLGSFDAPPGDCETEGTVLTMVINDDCDNRRFGLTNDIDDFQVQICRQLTDTCDDSFERDLAAGRDVGWSDISSVSITISGSASFGANRNIERTVSSQFLPRNILSFPQ